MSDNVGSEPIFVGTPGYKALKILTYFFSSIVSWIWLTSPRIWNKKCHQDLFLYLDGLFVCVFFFLETNRCVVFLRCLFQEN